jgi:hypothetical protein
LGKTISQLKRAGTGETGKTVPARFLLQPAKIFRKKPKKADRQQKKIILNKNQGYLVLICDDFNIESGFPDSIKK